MEENITSPKSIWGEWWTTSRKWFYPAWLVYETSIRFYEYALPVHHYFINQKDILGDMGSQLLAFSCSGLTFVICFFFLTVPASLALFKYFKNNKLANTRIESNIIKYL